MTIWFVTYNYQINRYRHNEHPFKPWVTVDKLFHNHQQQHAYKGCNKCDDICLRQVLDNISVRLWTDQSDTSFRTTWSGQININAGSQIEGGWLDPLLLLLSTWPRCKNRYLTHYVEENCFNLGSHWIFEHMHLCWDLSWWNSFPISQIYDSVSSNIWTIFYVSIHLF